MYTFRTKFLPIILTLFTVTFLTVLSMLYARGYTVSFNTPSNAENDSGSAPTGPRIVVEKKGILAVRSIPDSAKIYLNDELYDVTNSTISSLNPGTYNLRVERAGFEVWEKEIQVYEDLVTDVTATLVLRGSGLNPLTNTGVTQFEISNNGEMLAYLSEGEEEPGLWVAQLSNSPLNIFQTNKKAAALDNETYAYSSGEEIYWSPNDTEILVTLNERGYLLVDLSKPATQIPISYSDAQEVFDEWWQIEYKNKQTKVEALDIDVGVELLATSQDSIWSPDGEKFFILNPLESGEVALEVYNFEDPLPVGESREYIPITFENEENVPYVEWYGDSKHLLLISDDRVEIMYLDGTNRVEVFSGDIIHNKAFSSPAGDKVILLSKFKSNAPENLYTVSIR